MVGLEAKEVGLEAKVVGLEDAATVAAQKGNEQEGEAKRLEVACCVIAGSAWAWVMLGVRGHGDGACKGGCRWVVGIQGHGRGICM